MPRQLTDWLDSYMQYTENTEPPRLFHLWSGIGTIAAALQRKCVLKLGHLTFYPNMYIVLVGPPGTRKGVAMNLAKDFLYALNIRLAAHCTTWQGLVKEIMSCEQIEEEETEDENLASVLDSKSHSSLTVFSPELTVFLGNHDVEKLQILADWYDCGDGPKGIWIYNTATQGRKEIRGVWVNMVGCTTPDLLKLTVPEAFFGGGLMSRMMFIFESKKAKRVEWSVISPEEEKLREVLTEDLSNIYQLEGQFRTDKSFQEAWIKWYDITPLPRTLRHRYFERYAERRGAHVLKLCMICNASRTNTMLITAEDLERALHIMELTEYRMGETFKGYGKYDYTDVMMQIIEELKEETEISVAELLRRHYYDVDKAVMGSILDTLESMQYVKTKNINGERDSVRYIWKEER